jgi:hypothetical protein
MCTPFPKIRFFVPGLSGGQRQVFGNVFAYLGPHEQKFIEVFSKFGRIIKAVDAQPAKPHQTQQPSLFDIDHTA